MPQIVEEEKGCSGRDHPEYDVLAVGYGRGQLLGIASPYAHPRLLPAHLPPSCIPFPSCKLATDQRQRMAREVSSVVRGKTSKAHR
jgi:hypothetical protein